MSSRSIGHFIWRVAARGAALPGAIVGVAAALLGLGDEEVPGLVADAAAQSPRSAQTAWVTIKADGTILIVSPAAEMGQGSRTALALIIAEELDANWADVVVEMSPLDDKIYGNPFFGFMYTAGSSTVHSYFLPLRLHARTRPPC